jgi:hypothetical protein
MPKWQPTVPRALYELVADLRGEPFADSYLWGATVMDKRITPRTVTAWLALNTNASGLLSKAGYALMRPVPFGDPGASRMTSDEVAPFRGW